MHPMNTSRSACHFNKCSTRSRRRAARRQMRLPGHLRTHAHTDGQTENNAPYGRSRQNDIFAYYPALI